MSKTAVSDLCEKISQHKFKDEGSRTNLRSTRKSWKGARNKKGDWQVEDVFTFTFSQFRLAAAFFHRKIYYYG